MLHVQIKLSCRKVLKREQMGFDMVWQCREHWKGAANRIWYSPGSTCTQDIAGLHTRIRFLHDAARPQARIPFVFARRAVPVATDR